MDDNNDIFVYAAWVRLVTAMTVGLTSDTVCIGEFVSRDEAEKAITEAIAEIAKQYDDYATTVKGFVLRIRA